MHEDTVAFAIATPESHIAVVDDSNHQTMRHFAEAQRQLRGSLKSVSGLNRYIRLTNGTVVYFVSAPAYERLRGLRLDRIDTASSAIRMMPDNFLAMRLKPGVKLDEGIIYRESEVRAWARSRH
jgi:hypothetical protein